MLDKQKIKDALKLICKENSFILLDGNYHDDDCSYLFTNPIVILTLRAQDNVESFWQTVQEYLDKGHYAAGFITYEAAGQLDKNLKNGYLGNDEVTICFAIFKSPLILNRDEISHLFLEFGKKGDFKLECNSYNRDKQAYFADIEKLKTYLTRGDSYQVNYTYRLYGTVEGHLLAFYQRLAESQPVSFGAFIHLPNMPIILSRSPELFFQKIGKKMLTRPMKGTIKRGRNNIEDQQIVKKMLEDKKTRSENTIIVDLLRNDFSHIAEKNTVAVEAYLSIEPYKSLYQLTSTISCCPRENLSLHELFAAIFPCGSVTGAPKRRTMQIIEGLEKQKRGIYTGAIGYITPKNDMCFNVAIRTLEFQQASLMSGGSFIMGIGGGIIYDSDAETEYQECHIKADFLYKCQNFDAEK